MNRKHRLFDVPIRYTTYIRDIQFENWCTDSQYQWMLVTGLYISFRIKYRVKHLQYHFFYSATQKRVLTCSLCLDALVESKVRAVGAVTAPNTITIHTQKLTSRAAPNFILPRWKTIFSVHCRGATMNWKDGFLYMEYQKSYKLTMEHNTCQRNSRSFQKSGNLTMSHLVYITFKAMGSPEVLFWLKIR